MTPQEKELQQLRARVAQLEEVLKQYADAEEDSPHKPQIARAALYGREEKGKGV